MVNVIHISDSVIQVQNIADGSNDVRHDDVLRRKFVLPSDQLLLQLLPGQSLLQDLLENRIVDLLRQFQCFRINVHMRRKVDKLVSDDLRLAGLVSPGICHHIQNSRVFNGFPHLTGDSLSLFCEDLTGVADDIH